MADHGTDLILNTQGERELGMAAKSNATEENGKLYNNVGPRPSGRDESLIFLPSDFVFLKYGRNLVKCSVIRMPTV